MASIFNTIPDYCLTLERRHWFRRYENGLCHGHPLCYTGTKYITKLYPVPYSSFLLPLIQINQTPGDDAEIVIGIPYRYKAADALRGQRLFDEFDSTPKYMCSAELRDDGTFEINISFDLVDVIQSLRDKGTVSIDRGQRSVSVSGFIEGYEKYKGCSLSCTCMVAPELQGIEGKALCRSNCPVVVQGRVYENCTEAEILKALLDPSFIGCSSFDALTTRRDVYTEEHFYTPHDVFGEHWSHWKPSSPPIQVGDFEDDEFIVQLDINGVHEEAPGDGANGDAVQVEADVVEDGGAAFVWGQVADVDNGGWGAEPAEGAGWVGGWGEN